MGVFALFAASLQRIKQSTNDGSVALESYVVNHVMKMVSIGFLLGVAFVQFVRKALSDTATYSDDHGGMVRHEKHGNGRRRKSNRMV